MFSFGLDRWPCHMWSGHLLSLPVSHIVMNVSFFIKEAPSGTGLLHFKELGAPHKQLYCCGCVSNSTLMMLITSWWLAWIINYRPNPIFVFGSILTWFAIFKSLYILGYFRVLGFVMILWVYNRVLRERERAGSM